ncbi:MAG TPA: endonuclease V [Thermoplasmata archaeon]|nr:endonuclease V [Thermoplasmata archaeon]
MRDFGAALARCLREIPRGRTATCGVVARALGDVRAARAVALWLVEHPDLRGAHRIVRADGRPLVPEARERLAIEGIRLFRGRVPTERFVESLKPVGLLDMLRREQRDLESQVIESDSGRAAERIAGVDLAYEGERMHAAVVCVRAADLRTVEVAHATLRATFPYIPTYLAYREFLGIEAAVRGLSEPPDVLLVDGHGRLHPALFGVACYVGVRLDVPTIGVAKHPLVGRPSSGKEASDAAIPIEFKGGTRGYAWTPPGRARTIYISVGHRATLKRALQIVRQTTRHGYPEPLVLADRACRDMKRNEKREEGSKR